MENTNKSENKMQHVCCLCGKTFNGYGNNPWPLNKEDGARCCDDCDEDVVMARIAMMARSENKNKSNENSSSNNPETDRSKSMNTNANTNTNTNTTEQKQHQPPFSYKTLGKLIDECRLAINLIAGTVQYVVTKDGKLKTYCINIAEAHKKMTADGMPPVLQALFAARAAKTFVEEIEDGDATPEEKKAIAFLVGNLAALCMAETRRQQGKKQEENC